MGSEGSKGSRPLDATFFWSGLGEGDENGNLENRKLALLRVLCVSVRSGWSVGIEQCVADRVIS